MITSQTTHLISSVLAANEATSAATAQITARMIEQCQRVTELGREFVTLLSVDPSSLTPDECGTQAYLIGNKHKELAIAINELAQQPIVTTAWVMAHQTLHTAGEPFEEKYSKWCERRKNEQERRDRAATYREQCQRDQALHEQRLRGEVV